jgi:hypothetical protein
MISISTTLTENHILEWQVFIRSLCVSTKGFVAKGSKAKFIGDSKALYGLHQTPHVSYTKINDYLCNKGLKKRIKDGNFLLQP